MNHQDPKSTKTIFEINPTKNPFPSWCAWCLGGFLFVLIFSGELCAQVPTPAHIVIAIEENHDYASIIPAAPPVYAPYINALAADSNAALFTQSFALTHPSQPNYIMLFSGSNQGVVNDNLPTGLPFTAVNLGGSLLSAGKTFMGYSEDLPSIGYNGTTSGAYARKHNPWANWQSSPTNGIPLTKNVPLTSFPASYDSLPTVSFVIPNQNNDMHNGSDPTTITVGDTWLQTHLNGYIQWAKTHNSLFILTFDEGLTNGNNRIVTLFVGAMVKQGVYTQTVNHYSFLRTLEDMYGLPHAGGSVTATPITNCWGYRILASNGPNGTISPNGNVSVNYTANQTFTIAPTTGHHVDSVFVDGAMVDSTTSYTFANVTMTHSIRAVFAVNQYSIAASAGLHGGISPSGAVIVSYGGNQTFTMNPDPGYVVDTLVVDGAVVPSSPTYQFTSVTGNHTIRVAFNVSTQVVEQVPVNAGWNIVSIPLTVDDGRRTVVFPSAVSSAYAFESGTGYVVEDSLRGGRGYWLKFSATETVPITGYTQTEDTIVVQAGWNIIGSISIPVPTSSIIQIPPGIVASSYFEYADGYSSADTLQSGKGYWVKSNQAGKLVLH